MKKTIISALILSATVLGSAQAANLSAEPTREQVLAELIAARANGEIPQGEQAYPVIKASATELSRGQVQAELNAAVSQNLIPNGEQDFTLASLDTSSSLSRAQVVQALQDAKAQGLVTTGEADNVPVFASHDGPANRGQVVIKASNRFNG